MLCPNRHSRHYRSSAICLTQILNGAIPPSETVQLILEAGEAFSPSPQCAIMDLPSEPESTTLVPGSACALAIGLLLLLLVPLFVCSPVTSDTSLFDVQAMSAIRGGVLYRDIVEPNLPGIVWVHIALRSIVGWSSEAIRIADLLIFGLMLWLLVRVLKIVSAGRTQHYGLFVFACCLFYLTRNEWCHCQRDVWMLLPTSCAVWLRCVRADSPKQFVGSAVVEGIFWGIAFWIKPHVAIPATAAILIDLRRHSSMKSAMQDVGLVVLGGILAAVPGIIWLMVTGAWPHFWDMMLNWNPEYLATGKNRRSLGRVALMMQRFYPWWVLHLLALPVAFNTLWQSISPAKQDHSLPLRANLSAIYVAWLVQTFLLQHAMDYIHVPEVILAALVIAADPWRLDLQLRRVAVCSVLGLALIAAPQFYKGRLSVWTRCFSEGSSPQIRSLLASGNYPNWVHLAKVKTFLQNEGVQDGDVTCLNVHSIHLNQQLGVLPSTRYWSVNCLLTMYPSRYTQIMTTVNNARQRFVVTEDMESQQEGQILPHDFPGDLPVVFQSGTYTVYSANTPSRIASKRLSGSAR